MSEEKENHNIVELNNSAYVNANMLQIRLNTDDLIKQMEIFLRGSIIEFQENEKGEIIAKRIKYGEPKANDLGINSILNYIRSIFNAQTVQGNFDMNRYGDYIQLINENIADHIISNQIKWEIDDDDLDSLIDFIMDMAVPFFSRLVDNKERDSYSSTMRHVESNTMQKGGMFGIFKS
jgi:hypothetical protein